MGFLSKVFGGIKRAVSTVARIGKKIVRKVAAPINNIAGIVSQIGHMIPIPIAQKIALMADVVQGVTGKILNPVQAIRDYAGQVLGKVVPQIQTGYQLPIVNVSSLTSGFTSGITDAIGSKVQAVIDLVKQWITQAIDAIRTAAAKVIGQVRRLVDRVSSAITGAMNKVIGYVSKLWTKAVDALTQTYTKAAGLLTRIYNATKAAVTSLIGRAGDVAVKVWNTVANGYRTLIASADSVIARLVQRIGVIPMAIRDTIEEWIASARENIGKPLTELPGELVERLGDLWDKATSDDKEKAADAVASLLHENGAPPSTVEELRRYFNVEMPKGAFTRWALNVAVLVLSLYSQALTAAEPQTELLRQEVWHQYPARLVEPAAIVRLYYQGDLSTVSATSPMRNTPFHGICGACCPKRMHAPCYAPRDTMMRTSTD